MKDSLDTEEEFRSLMSSYLLGLKMDAGDIKQELRVSNRHLSALKADVSKGFSEVRIYRSSTNNYNFNPSIRVNLNQKRGDRSSKARYITSTAYEGTGDVVTSLLVPEIGPIAPLAGAATNVACRWGLRKFFS